MSGALFILFGAALVLQNDLPGYTVHRVNALPPVTAPWDAAGWNAAETVTVNRFHPRGSDHRPRTQVRVLHDGGSIAVMFRVEDRYVLARHTEYQSPTHKDSCVEFFVKPGPGSGYFNFEFNAIGTLLLWYVEKPRGEDGQFQKYTEVPGEIAEKIEVHSSLSGPIEHEIMHDIVWTVSFRVPAGLFEPFTGTLGPFNGQQWRANFFKCADETSHPHWGYWADVEEKLDFHQPDKFGALIFE